VCAAILAALAVSPLSAQSAGDGDLAKGVRLVDEGDFESAIASLNAAVSRLQARGGAPAELSRAYLYLAIAHLGLSQEQAARAKFLDAIQTDRSLKLSPHEFPPKVIQAFEQARKDAGVPAPPPPAPVAPPQPVAPSAAPVRSAVPPTVFFEAVKQGDFATVRQLLAEDPGLARQKDEKFGATALHWAALRGHQAVAALLVAQGANLDAVNRDGETPFQVAQRANRPELAALVKPAGAGTGPTLTIFEAAKRGDVAAVEQILARNPELARQKDTAFGATPLHWAALRGHEAVVSALLARGADPKATNNDRETPLQVAQRANRTGVVQLLSASGTAPASRPASPAPRTAASPAAPAPAAPVSAPSASSAEFFDAVRAGSVATVNALLARNPALAREKDPQFGATALHWAALRGHENVADLLIAQGADLKATNSAGETPLQVAERAGHLKVVGLLRAASRTPPTSR
jgi:ankyrin repeat protein